MLEFGEKPPEFQHGILNVLQCAVGDNHIGPAVFNLVGRGDSLDTIPRGFLTGGGIYFDPQSFKAVEGCQEVSRSTAEINYAISRLNVGLKAKADGLGVEDADPPLPFEVRSVVMLYRGGTDLVAFSVHHRQNIIPRAHGSNH